MKMTKKLLALAGGVAILASAFVFTGCKSEDDDDENGMFSGSNKDYSIDYTNNTSGTSRGYATTTFKHRGALCQITLNKESTTGAMGYIWDLQSNSSREVKDPRVFCIAGFNYNHTATNKVAYYVSRYRNITDINDYNFGATTATNDFMTSTTPVEKVYIKLTDSNSFEPTKDANGNVVVTIDVYEDGEFNWENNKRKYSSYNGGFKVDIYDGAVTVEQIANGSAKTKATAKIPVADLGYTVGTDTTAHVVSECNGAVYANVYANSTVKGSWHYVTDYSAAEVVEE